MYERGGGVTLYFLSFLIFLYISGDACVMLQCACAKKPQNKLHLHAKKPPQNVDKRVAQFHREVPTRYGWTTKYGVGVLMLLLHCSALRSNICCYFCKAGAETWLRVLLRNSPSRFPPTLPLLSFLLPLLFPFFWAIPLLKTELTKRVRSPLTDQQLLLSEIDVSGLA
jgi:hypothetical protein